MEEELNERGNGGDLDDDGDDAREFDDTTREVKFEKSRVLLGYDGIEQADEGEMKSVLIHVGYTMNPDEVKVPKPPDDWVGPASNTAKGGATFNKVDNPGRWSLPPCICVWSTRRSIQVSLSPSWLPASSAK